MSRTKDVTGRHCGFLPQPAVLLLTVVVLLFSFVNAAVGRSKAGGRATVLVRELNLRSGPGIKYPVIARLPKGSRLVVEFRQQGWLRVRYAGRKGYVRGLAGYLAVTGPQIDPHQVRLKPGQQSAEEMKRQLEAFQQRLRKIASQEADLLKHIDTVQRRLVATRNKVRSFRRRLAKLEKEITAAEHRRAVLQARINETARYAGARVVAWYKLSWIGSAQLLAGADSFFDLVVRRRGLETILEADQRLLAGFVRDQDEVERMLEALTAKQQQHSKLQRELDTEISMLQAEMKRRETLLDKIRNEKTAALANMAALQQAAEKLSHTLANFSESGRQQGAAKDGFAELQGLLSMPVKGKIVSFFGPYRDTRFNVVNFQNGIDVAADMGEPVRAVAKGYTMFASWVQGYGNLIIIDHGQHYYTVYAHLEEMFKTKGEAVDQGEVIATVGDSGALQGPGLHFEIRHRNEALDPMDWLNHN